MFSLAGSRTVTGGAARGLAVALAGILVAGCVGDREAVVRRLREDDPRTQVAAIAQVARAGDRTLAGELINLLESEDEGVRFMAASALHKLTGKDLGFHFANTPAERARIVAEWRAWWEAEGRAACGVPATESTPPPGKEPSGEPPKATLSTPRPPERG